MLLSYPVIIRFFIISYLYPIMCTKRTLKFSMLVEVIGIFCKILKLIPCVLLVIDISNLNVDSLSHSFRHKNTWECNSIKSLDGDFCHALWSYLLQETCRLCCCTHRISDSYTHKIHWDTNWIQFFFLPQIPNLFFIFFYIKASKYFPTIRTNTLLGKNHKNL